MKRALEILWALFVVVFCVAVVMLVVGCAAPQPKTQADLLADRVRIEKLIRACKNAGGVWINPAGRLYSGECNWHGRL